MDDVDSDSHSYGLSYNDSGLFSDSSVGSDFIENYFRQDNDSCENEYLQELGIATNDNNNHNVELVQRKQKRIHKPKKDDNIFSFLKENSLFCEPCRDVFLRIVSGQLHLIKIKN